MSLCWLNGKLMPGSEAKISVFDHGFLYGDGVFEGIRFYNGLPFRLDAHLRRLFDSAAAIALQIPYELDKLRSAVVETVKAYGQPDGYVRLVVTRGEGYLGIDPRNCSRGNVLVIVDQLRFGAKDMYTRGATVIVAAVRRLPPDGLDARIKSLNYLNHILARMEASRANADEAVLLNAAGKVTEGSSDNIFIVKQGTVLTPPASDGALEGITRGVVLEVAHKWNIPAKIQSLTPYDLYTADECFLTGTAAELIPVREIDGRVVRQCPGPVFLSLNAKFQDAIRAEVGTASV